MAEFLVYACRQCRRAYAGAVEATERPDAFADRTGLCGHCLEELVGWSAADEEKVESREDSSGTTPNA